MRGRKEPEKGLLLRLEDGGVYYITKEELDDNFLFCGPWGDGESEEAVRLAARFDALPPLVGVRNAIFAAGLYDHDIEEPSAEFMEGKLDEGLLITASPPSGTKQRFASEPED